VKYLLDTNVLSDFARGENSGTLQSASAPASPGKVQASGVTRLCAVPATLRRLRQSKSPR
jgi:predicted nucleic acid-binding protein